MILNRFLVVFATLAILANGGCSAQQGFAAGQAHQRQQCSRIADPGDYQRCMEKTRGSYEDYRRAK
jgi:hypothetical protein